MAYNNFQSGYGYPMYNATNYQGYPATQSNYAPNVAASYQAQQQPVGIIWVDGEVGAKAYQLPSGWPVNAPMPLWDTNDTVIYLKSTNQMGMPNPLQKIHYTMEEVKQQPIVGQSSQTAPAALPAPDMSNYATKDDIEAMKKELKEALTSTKEARTNGKPAV